MRKEAFIGDYSGNGRLDFLLLYLYAIDELDTLREKAQARQRLPFISPNILISSGRCMISILCTWYLLTEKGCWKVVSGSVFSI